MNSQELILGLIDKAIRDFPVDVMLIDDRRHGNTGTLRTVDGTTLEHIASVDYDFQQNYCHFGPSANRVAALWYGKPRSDGEANWVCGDIPELVNSVVIHLTTRSTHE